MVVQYVIGIIREMENYYNNYVCTYAKNKLKHSMHIYT